MTALDLLTADLRDIFGGRLQSLVVYQAIAPAPTSDKTPEPIHALALVEQVTFQDVAACAARNGGWEKQGLAPPLVMGMNEFVRSLDAFPLEYGQIIATHRVIAGSDPFEGLSVKAEDLRRACEVQAKSHLIHLREAYIEAGGRPAQVAHLIVASVAPFKALLASVARLRGRSGDQTSELVEEAAAMGLPSSTVQRILKLKHARDLASGETVHLFSAYLSAVEQLATRVDEWK
jgi:hypothetical protein